MMWACEKQQQHFVIQSSQAKIAKKKYSQMMSY